MSLTLTVLDHWTDGKKIHAICQIVPSGNYPTVGDTINFRNYKSKSSKPPEIVVMSAGSDMSYMFVPGTTISNGKIKISGTGGVAASVTLTSDGVNVTAGETVTLGTTVYTFGTALSGVPNVVLIGANASATLDNLKAAVNGATGAGAVYSSSTVANPSVDATTKTATTILFLSNVPGVGGNSIVSTETSAHLAFGTATLVGGTDNVGSGTELAAGAYPTGVSQDQITCEAIFPQFR